MKKLFLLVVLIVISLKITFGQKFRDYRTSASGNWSDPSIWEVYSNRKPDGFGWYPATTPPDGLTNNIISSVEICQGHTVIINSTLSGNSGILLINGNLITSFPIFRQDSTKNFPEITINGLLNTSSYVNAETFSIGSSGNFETSFYGSGQTEGWWHSSHLPSSINLNGKIIINGYENKIISNQLNFYDLEVNSPVSINSEDFIVNNDLVVGNTGVLNLSSGTRADINNFQLNSAAVGLVMNSTEEQTASLIIHGTYSGNGTTIVQRHISLNAWHLISVPIENYTLEDLITENNIDQNNAGTYYALRTLDESTGAWTTHAVDPVPDYNLQKAEGFYCGMSESSLLQFNGKINTGQQSHPISNNNRGWNAVGNPYTSSLGITIFSDAGSQCFLSQNIDNIDPNNLAVFTFDPITGEFKANSSSVGEDYLPLGQGFIVKSVENGSSLIFAPEMQSHTSVSFNKKSTGKDQLKGVVIKISGTDRESNAKILFSDNATEGLDPSWDLGGFGQDTDFNLYSGMIDDNGQKYSIQCLPLLNANHLKVPLGLDFKAGGQIYFSSENTNLPDDCQAYLIDRETGAIIDISDPETKYYVDIAPENSGLGRFYFYTYYPGNVGTEDLGKEAFTIYSYKSEITVKGNISENTLIRVYDISGKLISVTFPEACELYKFCLDNIEKGVYIVEVIEGKDKTTEKIIIR